MLAIKQQTLTTQETKFILQSRKGANRDVNERYEQECHTENTLLRSRMECRMESTSGLVPSKTLSSM